MYLCGSWKIIVKQRNIDNWYGRPESMLAQTFVETLKIGKWNQFLKIPKNIPKNPRDLPSMVANSVVSGKSLYGLEIRVEICMQKRPKDIYFLPSFQT
jgi:hypothetical protein